MLSRCRLAVAGRMLLGVLLELAQGAARRARCAHGRRARGCSARRVLQWLVVHGTDGILAAMRMGVWAHVSTYGAFAVCVLLLRGSGLTADRRANALHRVTRRIPEVAVVGLTVRIVVVFASIAIAGP